MVFAVTFLLLSPIVPSRAQDTDGPLAAAARMGERLFLETRFAEFFFTNSGGNANTNLAAGDPVMNFTQTTGGPVPGPFAGQSMNCRACHLVDEFNSTLGNRTYSDFTTHSPIPLIGDGRTNTPRNSPTLVNILLPHATPLFLHLDGQFANTHDLIIGTLTGRNYGWKPTEYATAISHIANILRDDDGTGSLAQGIFGGGYSYAQVISPDLSVPVTKVYRLNYQYTFGDITIKDPNDPNYVTDEQIVDDVAALILAYLETLFFAQDLDGNFIGSPYDQFLIKNGLPQQPDLDETPLQYSQRLLGLINQVTNLQFVTDPNDGHFTTQNQIFQFGQQELDGLKIFFARGNGGPASGGKTGNCVACHAPPAFTDFVFHNTGASQEEYDAIHGAGTFSLLPVPSLAQRQTNYDAYLPATTDHPNATGIFVTPPTPANPAAADLGLWNVFANPDFPAPQAGLQQVLVGLISASTPQICQPAMTGGGFAFQVTNGMPGWTYNVLETTELTLPTSEWNVVSTDVFDQTGRFGYTNTSAAAQDFYTLAPAAAPEAMILPLTVARFKTPTLRDLGQSEPYLHTGRMNTLEEVLQFYQDFSDQSRADTVRSGDPALNGISLDSDAITALAAFLRALNEDYTD
jgi:hypothetical protein